MERNVALRGSQLSFSIDVPMDVPPYPLENPPRQGDRLTTSAGIATVTHIDQVGREQVIWADYGSGIPQPHVSEGILSVSPPEQPRRIRRHTPKGKASGWIEERVGNKSRKTPSVSYYYCWDEPEKRNRVYVPVRLMATVRQMVEERMGVDAIVKMLERGDRLE
jgi:hypothetical protein